MSGRNYLRNDALDARNYFDALENLNFNGFCKNNRLDHRRPHSQTHRHRSRLARDSIDHARTLTTVFGTEVGEGSFLQSGHLRWDLRAIFRLAAQDRVLTINPADTLFTPRIAAPPSRRVLSAQDVRVLLGVLDLREQLIVRLALFSGMRPGEILALQWKHVADDHVDVMQRLYHQWTYSR